MRQERIARKLGSDDNLYTAPEAFFVGKGISVNPRFESLLVNKHKIAHHEKKLGVAKYNRYAEGLPGRLPYGAKFGYRLDGLQRPLCNLKIGVFELHMPDGWLANLYLIHIRKISGQLVNDRMFQLMFCQNWHR